MPVGFHSCVQIVTKAIPTVLQAKASMVHNLRAAVHSQRDIHTPANQHSVSVINKLGSRRPCHVATNANVSHRWLLWIFLIVQDVFLCAKWRHWSRCFQFHVFNVFFLKGFVNLQRTKNSQRTAAAIEFVFAEILASQHTLVFIKDFNVADVLLPLRSSCAYTCGWLGNAIVELRRFYLSGVYCSAANADQVVAHHISPVCTHILSAFLSCQNPPDYPVQEWPSTDTSAIDYSSEVVLVQCCFWPRVVFWVLTCCCSVDFTEEWKATAYVLFRRRRSTRTWFCAILLCRNRLNGNSIQEKITIFFKDTVPVPMQQSST